MPGKKLVLLALVSVAVFVVLTACGSGAREPLTLEEYLAWCEETNSDPFGDPWVAQATAGEYAAALEPLIERIASTVPPPELAAFHSALLQLAQAYADSFRDQDQDEPPSEFAMAGVLSTVGPLWVSTEEKLPPELRQRLASANCGLDDNGGDYATPEPSRRVFSRWRHDRV